MDHSCIPELSYQAEGYTRYWGLDSHATEKSFPSQSPQVPSLLVPSSPIMSFPCKLSIPGRSCQLSPPTHLFPNGEVDLWIELYSSPPSLGYLQFHLEVVCVEFTRHL